MNVTQLRYLIAAVKYESFVLASKELYVTPQALSKSIKALEKELEVSFFDKRPDGKGIIVLPFARIFAQEAEGILVSFTSLEKLAKEHGCRENRSSVIRCAIAAWNERGSLFDEKRLVGLELDKGLRVEYAFWPSEICISSLKAGAVDVAIVLGGCFELGFVNKFLFDFSPRLIVSGLDVQDKSSIDFQDLVQYKISTPLDFYSGYELLVSKSRKQGISLSFVNTGHSLEDYAWFLSTEKKAAIFVLPSHDLLALLPGTKELVFRNEGMLVFSVVAVSRADKAGFLDELKDDLRKVRVI
ncbi:MAG: LysR family transcriptional regulator [Eggerthellaceae bacterium]